MIEKTLEFRGIPLSHLLSYFQELDGIMEFKQLPVPIQGPYWQSEVLSEEQVRITSTFQVNAVHICFRAKTVEQLEQIIAQYRKKTFRAGG